MTASKCKKKLNFSILIAGLLCLYCNCIIGQINEGLPRQTETLTPPKAQNILKVYVNAKDELRVRDTLRKIDALTKLVKVFIMNPDEAQHLAETPQLAMVYLSPERGTAYALYLEVYNSIRTAYQELRQAAAQERYRKNYDRLSRKKQMRIRKAIPMLLLETEPTVFGEN